METRAEVKTVSLPIADLERLAKIARAARVSERIDVVGPGDDAVVRRAEAAVRRARALIYANLVSV